MQADKASGGEPSIRERHVDLRHGPEMGVPPGHRSAVFALFCGDATHVDSLCKSAGCQKNRVPLVIRGTRVMMFR
mgnify:CR=1 FL=1